MTHVRRALISVSDKTDLVPFARGLARLGIEIISTGGTARALAEAGLDVIPIDAVTGFPEMMDGRVKTLHPLVHGALLALRNDEQHVAAMAEHNITPIDLVCINLYPFEQTIRQADVTTAEAIEQIDIGGPSMIRSAAKNHAFVTVVTSVTQYDRVINDLNRNDGATSLEMRRDLAAAAFTRTAEYDTNISAWMCSRREEAFPAMLRLSYAHQEDLRYGENPHQLAAVYANPASAEPSVVSANLLSGKPLSYNNLNDAAGALELVQDLALSFPGQACATVVKHTNPCGAAVAETPAEAFDRAYRGDPIAAYGGILAMSSTLDDATAAQLAEGQKFFEVIVAPGFEPSAVATLSSRWANVRLLEVRGLAHTGNRKINYRSVPGGMLVQERDMKLADVRTWKHVAGPKPDEATLRTAAATWMMAKHLTSNAIAIGADMSLLGAGAGQMDRVNACRIAIAKSGDRIAAAPIAVAASDAFFPFNDGPQLLIDAGVQCIVHPGGSKRDDETTSLCAENDVTCLLTGVRHFRH